MSVRTIIIPPARDADTGEIIPDRRKLEETVSDLLSTLCVAGGKFEVVADRVQIGALPAGEQPCPKCRGTGAGPEGEDGCPRCAGDGVVALRPEPLAETHGFIIRWDNVAQLNEQSVTERLMAVAQGDVDREGEPVPSGGEED